jgi:hypothetical protein
MRGFVPSAAKKMCGALPSRCRPCSRCRRDLPRQAPRGPCGGSRHRSHRAVVVPVLHVTDSSGAVVSLPAAENATGPRIEGNAPVTPLCQGAMP